MDLNNTFDQVLNKLESWVDTIVLNLPNLAIALVVLMASIFVARLMKKIVSKAMSRFTDNRAFITIMSNIAVLITGMLGLFLILSVLNLSDALTAMLGTAGVAGLAVGLALQQPLTNLFSGMIMSTRPFFNVGDLVESNGYYGNILKINMRSTVIQTLQGQQVVIPNKDVIQNPLVNFTINGKRRVDVECGVAYGDDLEHVRETALHAVKTLLDDPDSPIELFYTGYGDSSINFILRFWLHATDEKSFLSARSSAIIAIKQAFDKANVTIPFPIRTLDFGVVGGERLDDIRPSITVKNAQNITTN